MTKKTKEKREPNIFVFFAPKQEVKVNVEVKNKENGFLDALKSMVCCVPKPSPK